MSRRLSMALTVVTLASIIGGGVFAWHQTEVAARVAQVQAAQEHAQLCQQVLRLEGLWLEEHPAYTASFYYRGAKSCGP